MPAPTPASYYRHTGTTNETIVFGAGAILHAIIPDAATAGTVIVRDQATAAGGTTYVTSQAAALPVAGVTFGPFGIKLLNGLTVQLSNGADKVCIVYTPNANFQITNNG